MKNPRSFLLALTVLLLAPLPLMAQGGQGQRGQGPGGAMMGARTILQHGSVEYLVTKAADLQLTTEQTAKLTAIGAAFATATKESRDRIAAALPAPQQGARAGGSAGGDRQAMMARMQEVRPLMTKLLEDDQKSLAEAMALLTDAQKEKAAVLLAEREPPRQRRG